MVDNAPSVGIVRCSKNPVDARDKNIQQRAKSLSLTGAGEPPKLMLRLAFAYSAAYLPLLNAIAYC